ncbi:MAG: polymer-forming cytoskeletal protein [Bdellovibrionota bacterium]
MGILKSDRSETTNHTVTPSAVATNGRASTQVGGFNAILDRGSEFEGKLTFEGTVRIDGTFKGQIHSEAHMVIGESGRVEGDIVVGSVSISGIFTGNIKAKNRVELHKNAVVQADIATPSLVIEDGVTFDGHCTMGKGQTKTAGTTKPTSFDTAEKTKTATHQA